MRLGFSIKIAPGFRLGGSRSTRRGSRTRLWASERIGPIRVSQSTTGRRRKRR